MITFLVAYSAADGEVQQIQNQSRPGNSQEKG
jgi:hypothetical protein